MAFKIPVSEKERIERGIHEWGGKFTISFHFVTIHNVRDFPDLLLVHGMDGKNRLYSENGKEAKKYRNKSLDEIMQFARSAGYMYRGQYELL